MPCRAKACRDAEDCPQAADAIGYPVVAKVCSPDILHKTELGGVKVGLKSAAAVESAVADMRDRIAGRHPDYKIDGY